VLADLRRLAPDVALIDVRGAREILEAARREGLPTRIVILTADLEEDLVYELLAAGAAGYLSKESDRQTVLDAVAAAARGEVALSPGAQTGLVRSLRRREAHAHHALTDREREVLALAAEGITTPEIAARLELSAATVKTHLQKAYEKLGVTDRTAAVALALRRGLLE
jgi:two-component system nitrate/nitrite response regulator NarL